MDSFKTVVFVFLTSVLLSGCTSNSSTEEKCAELVDKFTDEMVACYTKQEKPEIDKCREELLETLYHAQADAKIPKELFDKAITAWETRCEQIIDPKRYSTYILMVKGNDNPLIETIRKELENATFYNSISFGDTIKDIADRFGVPKKELGDEIAILYPKRAVFLAEKIKEILKKIPSAPDIKMIVKGNAYMFSFGIYVPQV